MRMRMRGGVGLPGKGSHEGQRDRPLQVCCISQGEIEKRPRTQSGVTCVQYVPSTLQQTFLGYGEKIKVYAICLLCFLRVI